MKNTAGILLYRIRSNDVEVLLVQNSKGKWSIPKGTSKEGEGMQAAARRELKTGTGLDAPERQEFLLNANRKDLERLSCFVSNYKESQEPVAGGEVQSAEFVSLADAKTRIEKFQVPLLEFLTGKAEKCA